MLVRCAVITVIGFFSGSILYSYLIPKYIKNVDVRLAAADGNPGSSNAIRAAGPALGAVCMALDVAKAFVPVFFAVLFGHISGALLIPVMLAPVLGHAFSPFLHFRGGKAVSASFGVLLGVLPLSRAVFVLAAALAFFKFAAVVTPDSAGVAAGFTLTALLCIFFEPLPFLRIFLVLLAALVDTKMLCYPDAGEPGLRFWHYSYTVQDNRLKIHKR